MKKETQIRLDSSQKIIPIEKPTHKEFKLFSELVLKDLGLEWGDDKKYLLHARLQRRLQILQMRTFKEYYGFVVKNENKVANIFFFISGDDGKV